MKTIHYFALVVAALVASNVAAFSTMPSLSDDYAAAQQRKALQEEILLQRPGGDVELPYYVHTDAGNKNKKKKKSSRRTSRSAGGGGFGGASTKTKSQQQQPKTATSAQKAVAEDMATVIRRDGVIRLPSLLKVSSCAAIREHVLKIQSDVAALASRDMTFDATDYYGVEPGRTCRTDLLLPLDAKVQGTLCELLQSQSPLRHLFCELFPLTAPLYEVAAVITTNGSHRQTIHPDLPYKPDCPLYVVFVALQDVTPDMGPTTFLRGTQHNDPPRMDDDSFQRADVVISPLKKGDAVVFDARVLHCGNANTASTTRCLFNFSFRQPDSGPLGYEGSIRKAYVDKMTLGEILQVADNLNGWGSKKTLESVYGNGLPK